MTAVPTRRAELRRQVDPSDGEAATKVAWSRDWAVAGRCAGEDPDALFGETKDQRAAKEICARCPVVAECLAEALDNRIEWGVWGGMTERERRALLRARPDIESWHDVLINYTDDNGEAQIHVLPR